ncbi:MAG: hypothetical protein LBD63_03295 [Mycoplasmataceae bacterium]|nr:hypothetical protein [Mycoplasmataceae bacterium]
MKFKNIWSISVSMLVGIGTTIPVIATTSCAKTSSWTIMIYLCGSNLESRFGFATLNLSEIKDSSFGSNINVLVETGGANQWHTEAHGLPTVSTQKNERWQFKNHQMQKILTLTSNNMGDEETLEDFIRWGTTDYVTQHYALIVWDHGSGVFGAEQDGITGDMLSMLNIHDALAHGINQNHLHNDKFDFIDFDCCLMADIETQWMLSPFANYLVLSEDTEPGIGQNYHWLNYLNSNSDKPVLSITKDIVDTYIDKVKNYNSTHKSSDAATLSVSRTDTIESLIQNFNAWINVVLSNDDALNVIKSYFREYYYNQQYEGPYCDLYFMAKTLINTPSVAKETNDLLKSITNFIVYDSESDKQLQANSHGLSIFLSNSVWVSSNEYTFEQYINVINSWPEDLKAPFQKYINLINLLAVIEI